MPVIGVLSTSSPAARSGELFASFNLGLRDGGFVENENVKLDIGGRPTITASCGVRPRARAAEGGRDCCSRWPCLRAGGTDVTKQIPIVFTTVTDPVKDGLVASLNKPGGNATGTAGPTSELDPKRLEILRELKPTATVVGVLVNPNRPGLQTQIVELQEAAKVGNKA